MLQNAAETKASTAACMARLEVLVLNGKWPNRHADVHYSVRRGAATSGDALTGVFNWVLPVPVLTLIIKAGSIL
jgi:hypothetical protein